MLPERMAVKLLVRGGLNQCRGNEFSRFGVSVSNHLSLVAAVFGVTVAIGVLVWLTLQIRARFRDGDDHADDPREFLTALRDSTRRGDVSDAEYRTIQGRLRNGGRHSPAGGRPPKQGGRLRTSTNDANTNDRDTHSQDASDLPADVAPPEADR